MVGYNRMVLLGLIVVRLRIVVECVSRNSGCMLVVVLLCRCVISVSCVV